MHSHITAVSMVNKTSSEVDCILIKYLCLVKC